MPGKTSKRFYTYRLLEVMDVNEYNALSDADTALLNALLSCGVIDITTGSSLRTFIFGLFPDGTNTYEALTELLAPVGPFPP